MRKRFAFVAYLEQRGMNAKLMLEVQALKGNIQVINAAGQYAFIHPCLLACLHARTNQPRRSIRFRTYDERARRFFPFRFAVAFGLSMRKKRTAATKQLLSSSQKQRWVW